MGQISKRAKHPDAAAPAAGKELRSNHGAVAPREIPEGWLWLGQIGRPHGIKGAFFLKTQDNRVEWPGYESVLLGGNEKRVVKVEKAYVSGGKLVLQLQDGFSREAIEGYYNTHLFVARGQIDLSESEYLVVDLVGCQVIVEGREGIFGEVSAVHNFGAQENLEIVVYGRDSESIFYPFTNQFIVEFNSQTKTLVIKDEPVFLDEGK